MLWMVRKSNKIIYKVVYIHALNVCCLASFGIIVGFGAKFLEITVNAPKPVTPIKDKRDTQAILRRTQDIKKERWLNNDTMGAVNDLGDAVVVGRNLGFSGKEKIDDDEFDMGIF